MLNPYHGALYKVQTEWLVLTKVYKATILTHRCLVLELVGTEDDAPNESC